MKQLLVLTLFLIASMILISPAFGTVAPSNSGTYMFEMDGNDSNTLISDIQYEVNAWFSTEGYNFVVNDLARDLKFENNGITNGIGTNDIDKKSGSWTTDQNFNFYSLKAGNAFAMFWLDPSASSGYFSTIGLDGEIVPDKKLSHITFYTATIPNPVPIPGAAWLLGSGMVGLLALRRRRIANYNGDTQL